jgi:hypothetical protein
MGWKAILLLVMCSIYIYIYIYIYIHIYVNCYICWYIKMKGVIHQYKDTEEICITILCKQIVKKPTCCTINDILEKAKPGRPWKKSERCGGDEECRCETVLEQ